MLQKKSVCLSFSNFSSGIFTCLLSLQVSHHLFCCSFRIQQARERAGRIGPSAKRGLGYWNCCFCGRKVENRLRVISMSEHEL
jgi:hypothetical protein